MAFDLTGLGAFAGSALQGYDQAAARKQQLAITDLQLQEARRNIAAEAAALSGLSAMDQGSGAQPPQQMQMAPMPGAPAPIAKGPGGVQVPQAGVPGPSTMGTPSPQGGGVMAGGMGGSVMPQPSPAASGGAPGAGAPMSGGYTISQLARVIKAKNPGLDDATVFQAVVQAQQLLNPYEKQMLNFLIAQQRNETTIRGQDVRAGTQERGQDIGLQGRQAQIEGRHEDVATQQAGADRRAQLVTSARTAAAAGQPVPPDVKSFVAQALRAGDTATVNEFLGFSRNRQQFMSEIVQEAQQQDPTFTGQKAAAAIAQFGGMKAGATVIGRTAGSTEVGAEELKALAPKITEVAKKLPTGRFPTVNSLTLAIEKGTGNADVVTLNSYVQTVRNAYVQVMARGGRMSDTQRKYAAELISGNMPINQLGAALAAIQTEAGIVQGATGQAMQNITGGGAAPAPAAGGQADPLGIR